MKKNNFILIFIIIFVFINSIAVNASSSITIDSNEADEGIVRISYDKIDKKTKVMIEKDSTKYYYDLNEEEEFFPLQLGEGRYSVSVLENTSGNKYKVISQKSFKADISEENLVYLKSIQLISWKDEMEAIELAKSLVQDEEDQTKIVQAIYDYIINNIEYDYQKGDKLSVGYIPDIETTFKENKGMCYDYSVLFAAMLRSRDIPTKLIKGYRDGIDGYHAWNEVYLDGSWKVVDTTYGAWALRNGTSCNIFQEANLYNKTGEY